MKNKSKLFMRPLSFFNSGWKKIFSVDLRALALLRIMLAVCCITEIAVLWGDAFVFFSAKGLNPHSGNLRWNWPYSWSSEPFDWSLYYISDHMWWVYTLFILTVLVNVSLLLGYRTRITTILSWILIVSLTNRIGFFLSGAQMQLRLLLFWSMFLPLGSRLSIDAALYKGQKHRNHYFSVATAAIMLQEIYLYFFGALQKTGLDWHENLDAVYYVMNATHITSPLAALFDHSVLLTKCLTACVYYLELLSVVFLFSPIKTARCRLFILPLLIIMHLGFAAFMSIGFFPLVSITGLIIFIPAIFWNTLLPWFNAQKKRAGIKIYYDKDCGFCQKICVIFRELSLPPDTLILPAQNYPEIYEIMQRENSWVLEEASGQRHTRWNAVAWCWRRSPLLWIFGIAFLPRFTNTLGDKIYRSIAHNRNYLGRLSAYFLPESYTSPTFRLSRCTQGAVVILTLLVMIWNIGHLPNRSLGKYESKLHSVLNVFVLWQQWKFFAPIPTHSTNWVVIEGHSTDGKVVDLLRNTADSPAHDRPLNGYAAYSGQAWIRFFFLISPHLSEPTTQTLLGRYFCSVWEKGEGKTFIKDITFSEYQQMIPPPLQAPLPTIRTATFSYSCPNGSHE